MVYTKRGRCYNSLTLMELNDRLVTNFLLEVLLAKLSLLY